jgi:(1->4)-alpha-D-glucan 1-alpha-D-glucosylmutase
VRSDVERRAVSRRPSSTYRLQLRSGLTLVKLRSLIDYFHLLGVSDLYLSPISRAESASPHGYAVVDFDSLGPRIGSIEELAELASDLGGRDMGLLLDFVSNHMAASPMEEEAP